MGFWDQAKKMARSGMNSLNELSNEVQSNTIKLQSKSDQELMRILKSDWSSTAEKMVAARILKERGYDRDDLD